MRLIASVVLLLLVGACGTAWSAPGNAAGTLRIGLLIPETGYLAAPGRFMREGFMLYLGQHGNKLGGRDVQTIVADDQANPSVGLTQARRLVEQDGAVLCTAP